MIVEDFEFDDGSSGASGFKLRGRQQEWCDAVETAEMKGYRRQLFVAPGGIGKCLARGTKVLMFDGTIKACEDIVVGDFLIGPDSAPRVVTSTCSGRAPLYTVIPRKGEPYRVTENHFISLKASCGKNPLRWRDRHYAHGQIINIRVSEWAGERNAFHHSTVGWRSGVEFLPSDLHPQMPPYMLGLWLGDGNVEKFSISKPDPEVYASVLEYSNSIGHKVVSHLSKSGNGTCPTHNVVSCRGKGAAGFKKCNVAKNALESLGVLFNKHVPLAYKANTRKVRLEVLAGILDADGSAANGCIDFISISRKLCDDVAFLARSLGMAAYMRPCKKSCQGGFVGDYFRLCISGDLSQIPFRIPRRRQVPRKQIKNVLHTGVKVVPPTEIGDYFGFEVAGPDHLFLLGDFTVTHNSSCMGYLAQKKWREHGIRTLITENREHLVEQTAGRVRDETGLDVDIEMAGQSASPHAPVVVASTQTLGRINRLTAFPEDHFGFVVPDECHLSLSPQSQRILNYLHFGSASLEENWGRPKEYAPLSTVCGFTASPNLGQGRSLGEWYNHVAVNYSYLEAIEEGWLVGLVEKNIPVTIDTRKFRTRKTSEGADFNVADQAAAIIPIIKELAEQIVRYAHDKKTICFLPSVECARLMAETLNAMGMRAIFASGECLDKGAKTEAYNRASKGTVLCNCALVTYGIDFVDTDCIAPFAAMISKCRYIQSIYRGTRVLKGILREGMTSAERRAAIARSAKPYCTILSPFFISDSIDICEPFDLFSDIKAKKRKATGERDLTKPEVVRDWIKSLEKAADPHQKKQARTIDPVAYSLSVGAGRLAALAEVSDGSLATRAELDALLAFGIDTTQVRTSTQAQRLISTLRERDRLGLASPKAIQQLTLRLGWPDELASKMKGRQAGVLIAKGVRYKKPEEVPEDDPSLAYGEG